MQGRQIPFRAYLFAMPSMFPPSPIVMYTGAERSFTGPQWPFTMLYATFEIRSWYGGPHNLV